MISRGWLFGSLHGRAGFLPAIHSYPKRQLWKAALQVTAKSQRPAGLNKNLPLIALTNTKWQK